MDLTTAFENAQQKVKTLSQKPDNQELLQLYSHFKQATVGDINEERPGGFDFVAIAKYNAWERLIGTEKDVAAAKYIELVNSLLNKYN
jgi:diazepam-binding inhibitor (GABA receptor modulator, acyl-CoA-binding protein)